ncbi:E3 ubiquitin protein ligase DRIP2 [Apostasia shenzhenica]|uniref:E3 ubiquitin protein ligase DRIP2 n=1 Tax=Apostasia shenzhenica TaxID=1088818 RepID=A0A2I0AMU7_9ASPA|nr:E3 ubiquitin protein ligase DRIP2 [Apostasia shenzhenica]
MVPARNLLRLQYDCYEGFFDDTRFASEKPACVRSAESMEEEPTSRGRAAVGMAHGGGDQEEEGDQDERDVEDQAGACSREEDEGSEGWLQLGIGAGVGPPASRRSPESISVAAGGALTTELELFAVQPVDVRPPGINPPRTVPAVMMPVYPPPLSHHGVIFRQDLPWGIWNAGASTTFVPAIHPPPPPYALGQYMLPEESSPLAYGERRVVSPQRRPDAGVWFLLQASQNQIKEPFLPQIPKSYLRIKDGRMTVRLLKKYLVNKLGLEDESEVEIWCRGQPLLPFLTLQHVRDNIWCFREEPETGMAMLPAESPSLEYLMTLHYGRSTY